MADIDCKTGEGMRSAHAGTRAMNTLLLVGALIFVLASGATSAAETTETPAPPATAAKADESPPPEPRSQSTRHQLRLDGQVLNYTATVGWLILKDDKDPVCCHFGMT